MDRGKVRFLAAAGLACAILLGVAGAQEPPPPGAAPPSELLLYLSAGTDPAAYARENGLVVRRTLRSDPDAHVFVAANGAAAVAHRGKARADVRVRRAYLNERLQRVKCAWVPNDPYYPNGSPAGFPGQWHLGNGAVPGVDVHVPAAWARDVTGSGVIVGIVDDGLETAHPDLAPNYVGADSYDFGQLDGTPNPVNGGKNEDRHGTSVAGVAAARGGNGIGGTGAAPLAGLAGLRIDFVNQTTDMFVDATEYHSGTIAVKNHSYGYSVPYIESELERIAVGNSTAAGTIHLFAAGNERGGTGQDSNKQDVQSSPDVIAVAAFAQDGKYSSYSSFGANVFVTAPSSGISGYGITTTDRVSTNGYNRRLSGPSDGDSFPNLDYTSAFGGTSSATPLASGILALVKQVQPALNTRFAKHLLVRTSIKVDPTDNTVTGGGDGVTAGSAWKTNAAGFSFNQNYGFGLIDADALTQQAIVYSGVTTVPPQSVGPVAVVGGTIPDNNPAGISRTFNLTATTPLEEMLIKLDVTHAYRGDVEAYLTSPSGTVSRLAYLSGGDSGANIHWTFVSNAFWGENPAGTWTLKLRDAFATDVGTWTSFTATARMGQLIVNTTPPVVSSTAPAGANPTSAGPTTFTATFSKAVTGVDAADFALTTTGGIAGASITGVSGSGSVYTVGVNTGSGSGTIVLDVVDNDSIQDAGARPLGGAGAGNGSFTLGQALVVDKAAPTVTINQAGLQADPVSSGTIQFTAVFSEGVNNFVGTDVSFTGSTAGGPLLATVSGPGPTYTVTVSGMSSTGLVVVSIPAGGAADDAGNGNAASTSTDASVLYDVTPPTVTIDKAPAQADPSSTSPILFKVFFSEPVTNFLTGDVTLSGSAGATTGTVTSTGIGDTYDVAVSGMTSDGLVVATILAGKAFDFAGNGNLASTSTDNTVVRDTTAPTVTVNQKAGQSDPANAGPIKFTVLFSEPVTDFTDADVSLAASTVGGTLVAATSGSGATYEVSVTGMSGVGTVVVSILAGAAVDLVNLSSGASTSLDNTVTYNPTALSVTINKAGADPTNASPIVFNVVFSESVTGFVDGEVSFVGSTAGGTLVGTVNGTGASYTVSVTGMTTSGNVVVSIPAGVAINAALTPNAASTSTDNSVAWDVIAPTVTINKALGQADPTNGAQITFTVDFSEDVTGFADVDVTLGGTAGATTAQVSGGPSTYTVLVSGMTGSGTVIATITANKATDLAGNSNTASTSTDNIVARDVTSPTVTITKKAGQSDPTNASPILFTVLFNESVTGFTGVSFTGSTVGGTLAAGVTGSGTTYEVSVTGMSGNGTVAVSIPAGAAADALGNLSAASTSATVAFDGDAPTVTIEQAGGQTDPTNGSQISFTVVFSEPAVGFSTGDVSLSGTAGATLAAVSGGPTTFTVTVSGMTGNGKVTVAVAAGVATDTAGNANEAATSVDASVTYDNTLPAATITAESGQADPANASPIKFTVVFSESVTDFQTGDVSLSGTAGATTAAVTGSGTTYTVSVSGMTSDGTVIASVAAGRAVDDADNLNTASGTATVSYDATSPSVTVNQAVGQADPTAGGPVLFTAVFSQAVTGLVDADVVVGGTAGGTATVSGGPTTWTISVAGSSDGTVTVSLPAGAASDAAGNPSLASTSTDASVVVDSAPPVVLSLGSPSADGLYGPGAALQVTVVFSKAVTVTGTPRLTLETGASDAAADYASGSGTATLTFAFTVAAGHESADLDVPSSAALTLQGGTIKDALGTNATLTLPAPGGAGSLGAAKAIVVDGTPPLAGTVSDGWTGADLDVQLSRTTIAAHWTGFNDPQSGIVGYEWAIGTTSGGQEILAFAGVGTRTQASTSAIDLMLALSTGAPYYVTVRATNGTSQTVTATSDGVTVTGTASSGPPAPAAFYATPADQSALLDWIASGGAAFHRVWWKPAASPWTDATLVDALIGTDAVVAGLTNGVSHDFRLKAVDADGNESPGILASATPRAPVSIGGLTYPSPQDALLAAVAGDTVLLGYGTFPGPLTLPPGVSIEGISPVHTILEGTPGSPVITVQGSYPTDGTSTISDLTITTGSIGVDAGAADVALDHLVIHHVTSHGAASGPTGRLSALNCTLMSNGGHGLWGQGTASARNCVAGRNGGMGLNLPSGAAASYNGAFANLGGDFAAGLSGPGNTTAAAAFVNEPTNDYRETGLSPTVDAGDPADGFSREPAPHGSRINQGAFGDTRWAASRAAQPSGGGGGGGGGCGTTGLELLLPWLLLAGLRRLRR